MRAAPEHSVQAEHLFFLNLADPSGILRDPRITLFFRCANAPHPGKVHASYVSRTYAHTRETRQPAATQQYGTHRQSRHTGEFANFLTPFRLSWLASILRQPSSLSMTGSALCRPTYKLFNITGNCALLLYQSYMNFKRRSYSKILSIEFHSILSISYVRNKKSSLL